MFEMLLHTPEGVRDIYNSECEKKMVLQNQIHAILKRYGFHDIQTPTFEYFDIFNKERGSVSSKDMYKFFDREGNTLVLRPDMTPSLARCIAKYYKEEELPIRLCYMGNTFINNSSYQGKLKETTQIGTEFYNDDSADADGEMIALIIDCLLSVGLEEFHVEIGQADFFRALVEEAGFDEEEVIQLRERIENKNQFGVEDLIQKKNLEPSLKELFLRLPELFGSVEILMTAKEKTKNKRALQAIERLEKVYEMLETYGLKEYVSFDLGKLSEYNYYTGIVFHAYTYGTGGAVVKGGRYDNLVRQFGKDAPAIGFAIVIDQLMAAITRQKIEIPEECANTLILYQADNRKTAILLADYFRKDGMNIELTRWTDEHTLEEYIAYAAHNKIGGILSIRTAEIVEVINLQTGEKHSVTIKDLIKN